MHNTIGVEFNVLQPFCFFCLKGKHKIAQGSALGNVRECISRQALSLIGKPYSICRGTSISNLRYLANSLTQLGESCEQGGIPWHARMDLSWKYAVATKNDFHSKPQGVALGWIVFAFQAIESIRLNRYLFRLE